MDVPVYMYVCMYLVPMHNVAFLIVLIYYYSWRSTLPIWEELLVFNENYHYFIQEEPNVMAFFEVRLGLGYFHLNFPAFQSLID